MQKMERSAAFPSNIKVFGITNALLLELIMTDGGALRQERQTERTMSGKIAKECLDAHRPNKSWLFC